MPILGIIRFRGASSGSVIRCRMIVSAFVGFGENQDMIALRIMARLSTSHMILIMLNT